MVCPDCFQGFEHWLRSLYDLVQKGLLACQLKMERNDRQCFLSDWNIDIFKACTE